MARGPRPGRGRRLGLLAAPDFRMLWIGETVSGLGSSVGAVALPLTALTVLHAGVFAVSVLTAARWMPWLAVGLPAGAWVDRLPRRRVMIAADLVSLAAFASVPVAASFGLLGIAQLLVVALVAGTANVFFVSSYRALLPALVGRDDLLSGNALLQGSEQVTQIAGPGAAGVVAQATNAVLGVLADAASFAVSAMCLCRIRVREPVPSGAARADALRCGLVRGGRVRGNWVRGGRVRGEASRLRREIAEGLAVVVLDPLLRMNTLFGSLANFVLTGYQAVLVVYLVRIVGLSAGATGVVLAITGLGGVLGALLARRAARYGTARAVLVCKVGAAPFGLLIPLADRGLGLGLFLLGDILLTAGIVAGNIIWSGFVQGYYPAEMLGRVSTSVQFFNYGGIPCGAIVAGILAGYLGIRPTLWIMLSGLVLSSFVLIMGPLRRLRDLPSRPGPALRAGRDPGDCGAS